MATKSNRTRKTKTAFHKQANEELERSIILMVLSNPHLENLIIHNYLERNGLTVVRENREDLESFIRGMPVANRKSLARQAEVKAEAENLYQRAQELREENELQVAQAAKKAMPNKIQNQVREQNIDRMLKGVLTKANQLSDSDNDPEDNLPAIGSI